MKNLLPLFIFLLVTMSYAQKDIVSSGGNAIGTGGSVDYTVGQVAYQTKSNTNASMLEGVQQPVEIYALSVTGVETAINATLYPVPATTLVNLKLNLTKFSGTPRFEIVDINGRILSQSSISANHTQIDISHLETANYFFNIVLNKKRIKTFKLIKN
ncbi:T9SS type A sorting domain-containing protein [Subsaximicrobium wynnwilliamsii]|uniref:T9SS type A sorting domain-containing protein n=1 Tax=Subsaximicrobium wynnwilliamsii TaxID=291179 RepID=A0A5C6ZMU2_9FLAO|nr:T9SS type A sorting domain-containing protein [Subsaximicrobium wynnwilliamsii]TXD84571.1 T9SS type A sorting domain-containing protein [Subsaximicrobium wynnwilliamsii]TXD90253.1 T9SS type A sorting domain-containing protein [Subsaximicrobium wynnwilliamsii]TXE04304.1 T9SS type A sorting domain-containing protein [Subsaximicrobium wynnwilliamsii]